MIKPWQHVPLYINVLVLFMMVVGVLAGLLITQSHQQGAEVAMQAADRLMKEQNDKIMERVRHVYEPVMMMTQTLAALPAMAVPLSAERQPDSFQVLTLALEHNPNLYSVYFGYENGDFFQVARLEQPPMQQMLGAPAGTVFGIRTIIQGEDGVRRQTWRFVDGQWTELAMRQENATYDPRSRPWYQKGLQSEALVRTDPYIFVTLRQPGITFARRCQGGVVGADIFLATLSRFLQEQKFTSSSIAMFFNQQGEVTGFPDLDRVVKPPHPGETTPSQATFAKIPDLGLAQITGLFQQFQQNQTTGHLRFQADGQNYIGHIHPIAPWGAAGEYLGLIAPEEEFLGPIKALSTRNLMVSLVLLLATLPIMWWVARIISKPLVALVAEIEKMRTLKLYAVQEVPSRVREIHQLTTSFNQMARSIRQYENDLLITQHRLRMLVDIGMALSQERDFARLMESILQGGKSLCHADGGTLYLRTPEDTLRYEIVLNDTLGLMLGGTSGREVPFPSLVMAREPDEHDQYQHLVVQVASTGQTVRIDDVYAEPADRFPGIREFDRKTGFHTTSVLTVPLKPREGKVVGVLQLINARQADGQAVIPFQPEIIEFIESLAAIAGIALENQKLIHTQKELFNAFIKMTAFAIDAKSPYTGGHCERVPVLASLLAEAAVEEQEGPFSDFAMTDEDRYELHVAAWLHDSGKVATPEYVVDKATKLETIHNRLHEVRTRFEVLRRDAEIAHLQKRLAGAGDARQLEQELAADIAGLEEDYAFIAACNLGESFMDAAKKERVRQIANRRWQRFFDDRLGLAHDELGRKDRQPPVPLPAWENLLADKEEHVILRPRAGDTERELLTGFALATPAFLYNHGEIYNLCIERGTLNAEERYKINEHIMLTIRMLEKLPFPEALQRVPEFAGGHHETMVGTGYPRKLTREQMSLPARIMAIADIFEALTASDRPYKKAKTLSEALRIMYFMKKDQHIDGELFDLFLRRGVYRRYAEMFLHPEQRDEPDITPYLGLTSNRTP